MKAVITETLDPACADWLAGQYDVQWCAHDDPGFDVAIADAQALVVRTYTIVNAALLDKAPKLKVVGRAGVGLDNIDVAACRARGVAVVHTPDANTQAVVEYVLGLMLDWARPRTDLPPDADADTFFALRKSEVGRQLDQLTIGILGLGRIGKRVGQIASTLGMGIKALDLLPQAQLRRAVDYPFEWIEHGTQWSKCDIVTIHIDGRPKNRHLINTRWLDSLRDDVLLINAARGMLVDHNDLTRWAAEHPQANIVLDVLDPEPPPPPEVTPAPPEVPPGVSRREVEGAAGVPGATPAGGYPLRGVPNIRILPHLASRTGEALANMSWVVRDVDRVLRGQPPQSPA